MVWRLLHMVAQMIEDEKLRERITKRNKIVSETVKKFDGQEIEKYEKIVRTYKFICEKLRLTNLSLSVIEKGLENNQKSFVMQALTNDTYRSNQDFFQKITLELRKDFYELELAKIGITYVYHQKEYELIRDQLNNPNLTEDQHITNQLVVDLYDASLRMKVLQRMGYFF